MSESAKKNEEIENKNIEEEMLEIDMEELKSMMGEDRNYPIPLIELDVEDIMKIPEFTEGLNEGMRIGGMFTAMVNSGMSLEMSETIVYNKIMGELQLEIHKNSYEDKLRESESNKY